MMPASLRKAVEAGLGTPIDAENYVGGGDINQSARIQCGGMQYFIKWNARSPAGMFTAEAQGLGLLAGAGALRVPGVITYQEADGETPAFLVLEWIEPASPQNSTVFAERLGEGLAALHSHSHAQHGLDHDNFIGSLPQRNTQHPSWSQFYDRCRILPQQEIARQKRRLTPAQGQMLNSLRARLETLLPNPAPALLHGDLWGGNYMGTGGDLPVIYDPAVYFGHREIELAFTELFGGFPRRFYQAYNAVLPPDNGYQERKALYQLYPLMVHMNLFGGGYTGQVDAIIRRYVA